VPPLGSSSLLSSFSPAESQSYDISAFNFDSNSQTFTGRIDLRKKTDLAEVQCVYGATFVHTLPSRPLD